MGGTAVVWLCKSLSDKDNKQVAIKQIPKAQRNEINYKSGLQEIRFHSTFYGKDGTPHDEFKLSSGL